MSKKYKQLTIEELIEKTNNLTISIKTEKKELALIQAEIKLRQTKYDKSKLPNGKDITFQEGDKVTFTKTVYEATTGTVYRYKKSTDRVHIELPNGVKTNRASHNVWLIQRGDKIYGR